MKLLRTFPKDAFGFGLASWQWLGLREQTPRFATCFGDIFLESLDGWWFLDTVEGTLELRWTSAVTMYEELESPEGRATYLMDDLVRDARSRGIHLGEEDVYMFNPHPVLGGELSVHGLAPVRFELAVNWVGHVHDQVLHSSGEIRLPPMPDGSRRAAPSQPTTAWGSSRPDDETFDVPFEQYLATTTFAAVASPAARSAAGGGSGGRHSGAPARDALTGAAQPYTAAEWPTPAETVAPWPEQADLAQPWPEPVAGFDHAAPAPQYDGSGAYHSAASQGGAAPEWAVPEQTGPDQYGVRYESEQFGPGQFGSEQYESEQHGLGQYGPGQYGPGAAAAQPGTEQSWAPYDTGQDVDGHALADHAVAAWGSPTWGSTWGGQTSAVAAGGHQQSANDPFTAWDDLWGKR